MYTLSDVIEEDAVNVRNVESIREWKRDNKGVSMDVLSGFIHVTLAQFKAVVDMLSAHKDWDDKKIAKEIDWLELA